MVGAAAGRVLCVNSRPHGVRRNPWATARAEAHRYRWVGRRARWKDREHHLAQVGRDPAAVDDPEVHGLADRTSLHVDRVVGGLACTALPTTLATPRAGRDRR